MSTLEPLPPRYFHSIHAIPGQALRSAQQETGLPLIQSIRDLHSRHWKGWPPAGPKSSWRPPTELSASQAALNILSVALGVIVVKQDASEGKALIGHQIPGFMQLGPDHFVEGSSCHWGLVAPAESFIRFDTAAALVRGQTVLPACLSQPHTLSLIDSHLLTMPRMPAQAGRCRISLPKVFNCAHDPCGPPPSLVVTAICSALVFAAQAGDNQIRASAANAGAAILRLATQIANRMVDEASPVSHFDPAATHVYVERPGVNTEDGLFINVQAAVMERLDKIAVAAMKAAAIVDTASQAERLIQRGTATEGPDGLAAVQLTREDLAAYLDSLPAGQGAQLDDFDRAHTTGFLIALLLCEGGSEVRSGDQSTVVATPDAIRNALQNFHLPHDHASRNN